MTDALVIVFVKNMKLGTVKTRLAKTIGDIGAFEVYSALVNLTEKATSNLDIDRRIYFSDTVEKSKWPDTYKTIQTGKNLGERMQNAFKEGFDAGYKRIVLIGSDLPDISATLLKKSVEALAENDVVFGPAEDGGYYLLGMSRLESSVFEAKPWSQPNLLDLTLKQLREKDTNIGILEHLNDIDTYEDLIASDFYKSNQELKEKIQELND